MSTANSSDSKLKKKALVFGATGLVGKQLIQQLVAIEEIERIHIVNRREQLYSSNKIKQYVIDYSSLEEKNEIFKVDQVYICLGTTIKKAGSKANFEEVDLILAVRIAKMAANNSVEKLIMISSMGAEEKSSNFYLSTKGKAENQIKRLEIPQTYFVRPSLLLGDRKEKRVGESIAKIVMSSLSFLFIGPFKNYKAIKDTTVAKAMIHIMFSELDSRAFENKELFNLAE